MSEDALELLLAEASQAAETPPGWHPALKPYLSASSLAMLERCPEMYRRVYVLGLRERPAVSLLWGSADSKAHEHNFTQKIDSHEDVPVSEVEEVFAEALDEQIESVGGSGEIDWRGEQPGEVKDRGVALVACYHKQVSPRLQPIAAEDWFELEIPGVPVPVVGRIDVATADATIERKTAGMKSTAIKPDWRLQTLLYQYARSQPVEVHIATKTKLPAVYTPQEEPGLLLPLDETHLRMTERIIATRARMLLALVNEFGPDQPWPDAIGDSSWNRGVCGLCGWGPNGTVECDWWAGGTTGARL